MRTRGAMAVGAGAAVLARAGLGRALAFKFRRDLAALNAGDHAPLLRAYADDAVLRFNPGDHRWAGEHRGRAAIERFLREFTRAGLQGELRDLALSGPPWRLVLWVRFDDHARGPGGEELYRNRIAMRVATRWGRIVEHEDFYEDTERIASFERRLRALGIAPGG